MKKLIPLSAMILLLSCKNGTSQSNTKPQRMYTEAELQAAVRKTKEEQRNADQAIETAQLAGQTAMEQEKLKEVSKTHYVFGVITVSFFSATTMSNDNYSYSTKIFEYSKKPTKDEEYRLLDDMERNGQISIDRSVYRDFKLHKRKVFIFNSYAEASEKQQEINKYGLE